MAKVKVKIGFEQIEKISKGKMHTDLRVCDSIGAPKLKNLLEIIERSSEGRTKREWIENEEELNCMELPAKNNLSFQWQILGCFP